MLREVHLTSPIHLVAGNDFQRKLVHKRRDANGLPAGLDHIVRDLAVRPDGVSAVVTEWPGHRGLQLHTYAYVVKLRPSTKQDFFWVNDAGPLGLGDHARLTRGCLLVRCHWKAVARATEVPTNARANWDTLLREWTRLQHDLADQDAVPRLKPEHTRYLDLLTTFNEIARTTAARTSPRRPGFAYRKVTPVGDPGFTVTNTYAFHIVGRAPQRRAHVQISGDDERRGQVLQVTNGAATVRFDQPLDFARLPQQGQLVPARIEVVHVKRREAVEALRARQTQHRSLLDVVVSHQVAPIPQVSDHPAQQLDPEQLAAFRKALAVEDVLVVLGPPGTGKTRVITEVAHALGRSDRGKILITSHSNKAVDNVLARMPREVITLRVGNEVDVDPDVHWCLLEVYAHELRQEVAVHSERRAQRYAVLPTALDWHAELGERIRWWRSARAEQDACAAELDRCRRAAGGPAQDRVTELSARVRRLDTRSARVQRRLDRLVQRAGRSRTRIPLLSDLLGRLRDRRIAHLRTKLATCAGALDQARKTLRYAAEKLEAMLRQVPEVQAAQRKFDAAATDCVRAQRRSLEALGTLRTVLLPVEPLLEVTDTDDETTLQWLTDLHHGLHTRFTLLQARATLLDEWHAAVSSCPTADLHPELIRYADVIGATCIGSATNEEIAAEEFDLVIADEAGQIQVSDVLIPLIRGRRAVLVGDNMQLPPVSTHEVERAISSSSRAEALLELSRTSLLETLVTVLPADNVVQLRTQRRMPEVIASFVSDHFYRGTLRSKVPPTRDDALFRSPLAFVDTSCLPAQRRREHTASGKREGYLNHAEAELLNRLAEHYQHCGAEWALIVPYQVQRDLLKQMALGWAGQKTVDSNIGTVDAFQGGERDVVIYGFTRSNPGGWIGFLDDLRRLNVAFTRAKQRLVLVGDMTTLRGARDAGFRELMEALHAHLQAHGELRTYHDIVTRLTELGS
ncbi:hypothetical protein GCM10011581_49690 [Saccharopolyspora subtropica]|uniref:AAA domain-containing protein n=1 Tax=Saccharopolyspora thermophila TaxID=89367 RepID=A0A917KCK3_9PSEU|nr:AAA domain-containing protein [Saccharopolyspora subtropica]GGJ06784.1 hypothetical protein GCM10011581_49690 [Saccharopolyspora subtropica]